jgi:Zn finger protein HypA/HybF involved in hydrogenase expression
MECPNCHRRWDVTIEMPDHETELDESEVETCPHCGSKGRIVSFLGFGEGA